MNRFRVAVWMLAAALCAAPVAQAQDYRAERAASAKTKAHLKKPVKQAAKKPKPKPKRPRKQHAQKKPSVKKNPHARSGGKKV